MSDEPGNTSPHNSTLPRVDPWALLDTLTDGVAFLDADGRVCFLNAAWKSYHPAVCSVACGSTTEQYKHADFAQIFATSADALQSLTSAIRMVLDGKRDQMAVEHPCCAAESSSLHSNQTRWLRTSIMACSVASGRGALLLQRDMTDRKRLDERLREAEVRAQTIFRESLDVIILIDGTTGLIRDVNQAVEAALGYQREHLIGQYFSVLMASDTEVSTTTLIEDIRMHGAVVEALQFRSAQHTLVPMDLTATIISLGSDTCLLATLRDVTERSRTEREAEAALHEREARYRLMMEQRLNAFFANAPAGLVLFDDQLRYQKINETAACMSGLSIEEHLGKTIPEVLPDLVHIEPLYRQVLTTGEPITNIEISGVTAAQPGVQRHWQVSIMPIPGEDSTSAGVGAIFVEMTEIKHARQRLQQANEELEQRVAQRTSELSQMNGLLTQEIQERIRIEEALEAQSASLARQVEEQTADLRLANAQLERAARLKDEFLANMSHELRTPLNAILGLSEVLQDEVYGPLNEKQQKSSQTIAESGRHLLELINDILDLAKVGAGKVVLEFTNVSIEAVCQASMRLVKQTAHKKRLVLHEMIECEVRTLRADERRLKQMLVNLLSNAVKFTPEGGQIGLMVKADHEHQSISFTVWDTGIGIAPQDLKRLFRPFEQVDSSLSRCYEGTGLGLVLVARLAEMHRGSVSVESEIGKGSRFTLSLPLGSADSQPSVQPPDDGSGEIPTPLAVMGSERPHRSPHLRQALIIEDSPTAADQMVRYLNDIDVRTSLVACGNDALHTAIQMQPDVIILDILLPDASGWDVLRSLQSDPRTNHIPVIITSVIDERWQGLDLGASAYLVKPITRQQLLAELAPIFPHIRALLPSPATTVPADAADSPLVLLAEDNEDNIKMLSEYLEMRGYRVQIAHNGIEAVEYASKYRPAIILMDIQMPEMDGLEAIRHIRANVQSMQIPIIAVTALAMPGDRERCLAAGANDYMSKPISLKQLRQMIEGYT